MNPLRGAVCSDSDLRRAAAAFARPLPWRSVFQLVTSFGPFIAGCAGLRAIRLALWDEAAGRLVRFGDARPRVTNGE